MAPRSPCCVTSTAPGRRARLIPAPHGELAGFGLARGLRSRLPRRLAALLMHVHDRLLPVARAAPGDSEQRRRLDQVAQLAVAVRSEEHTSELQSLRHI